MMTQLKKIAGIGAVLAALAATPAVAQDLVEWDSDYDGALSNQEFGEGWSAGFDDEEGAFGAWDTDGDGALTEDEYNTGVYNSYDADRDGSLNEEEFGEVGEDMGDGGFWNS